MTIEFIMPWFSLRNITYVFSAESLLFKSPVFLDKKQPSGSFLVFEQRTKQIQFVAQIDNDCMQIYLCDLA